MAPGKSETEHCTAVSKQRGNPVDTLLTASELFCHLKSCLFHLCYFEIFGVTVQLLKKTPNFGLRALTTFFPKFAKFHIIYILVHYHCSKTASS